MADTKKKLYELLDNIVKENQAKGLSTNCIKRECMVVTRWTVQDARYGKWHTETQRRMRIAKDAIQKLIKLLKKNFLRDNENDVEMLCNINPCIWL